MFENLKEFLKKLKEFFKKLNLPEVCASPFLQKSVRKKSLLGLVIHGFAKNI